MFSSVLSVRLLVAGENEGLNELECIPDVDGTCSSNDLFDVM